MFQDGLVYLIGLGDGGCKFVNMNIVEYNKSFSLTSNGKRCVWGGRGHLRSVLFVATLAATRSNPVIRTFYQRLREAGKPFKVALTACMRKQLTILNAIIKTHTPWRAQCAA